MPDAGPAPLVRRAGGPGRTEACGSGPAPGFRPQLVPAGCPRTTPAKRSHRTAGGRAVIAGPRGRGAEGTRLSAPCYRPCLSCGQQTCTPEAAVEGRPAITQRDTHQVCGKQLLEKHGDASRDGSARLHGEEGEGGRRRGTAERGTADPRGPTAARRRARGEPRGPQAAGAGRCGLRRPSGPAHDPKSARGTRACPELGAHRTRLFSPDLTDLAERERERAGQGQEGPRHRTTPRDAARGLGSHPRPALPASRAAPGKPGLRSPLPARLGPRAPTLGALCPTGT